MDYILGFLIILVICIYIYVFNNQYLYKINNSFIKNKEELIKNGKKYKNYDKFQDIVPLETELSSDNTILVNNTQLTLSNISIKINDDIINDNGDQIFYLNDSKDKFNFKIVNFNINDLNIVGKIEIIIDGEHKLDHRKIIIDSDNILSNEPIEFDIKLNHKVKYNINIVNNIDTGKELLSYKKFIIGDKRFNYFGKTISELPYSSDGINSLHLILKNSKDRTLLYADNYLINTNNNKDIELCQKHIEKLFLESEKNNKSYFNIGSITLEPFNFKSFKITIPDFKSYFNFIKNSDLSIDIDNNEINTLANFVPDRIETKLLIVDENNKCEVDFSKNDYVEPQIESDNGNIKIIPGIKNYLINIKFLKSEYYNKKVIYIVKLNLIYKNLINTQSDNLLERNAVPLIFCFTINKELSKKNDLIYKDINFSKNIKYKKELQIGMNRLNSMQDSKLNSLDNILNTQINKIVNLKK